MAVTGAAAADLFMRACGAVTSATAQFHVAMAWTPTKVVSNGVMPTGVMRTQKTCTNYTRTEARSRAASCTRTRTGLRDDCDVDGDVVVRHFLFGDGRHSPHVSAVFVAVCASTFHLIYSQNASPITVWYFGSSNGALSGPFPFFNVRWNKKKKKKRERNGPSYGHPDKSCLFESRFRTEFRTSLRTVLLFA